MSYNSEADRSSLQPSSAEPARQSTIKTVSSQQNENAIAYKFEYLQPDGQLIVK